MFQAGTRYVLPFVFSSENSVQVEVGPEDHTHTQKEFNFNLSVLSLPFKSSCLPLHFQRDYRLLVFLCQEVHLKIKNHNKLFV